MENKPKGLNFLNWIVQCIAHQSPNNEGSIIGTWVGQRAMIWTHLVFKNTIKTSFWNG